MSVILRAISVFWTGVSRPVAALQTKVGIEFSFQFNSTPHFPSPASGWDEEHYSCQSQCGRKARKEWQLRTFQSRILCCQESTISPDNRYRTAGVDAMIAIMAVSNCCLEVKPNTTV